MQAKISSPTNNYQESFISLDTEAKKEATSEHMTPPPLRPRARLASILVLSLISLTSFAADHNDPNAINSIFADIDANAADLYDLYGFPSDDATGGEKVVIALTFASVPGTGVFDPDLLYRILISPEPRVAPPMKDGVDLDGVLKYFISIKDKYLGLKPSQVRVTVGQDNRAKVELLGFPSGNFTQVIDINKTQTIEAGGNTIKAFVGGRDDAFFNDLPGFFRSINYAPQYYNIPLSMTNARELEIPKTLIELEGNDLFNYDPSNPEWGITVKKEIGRASCRE